MQKLINPWLDLMKGSEAEEIYAYHDKTIPLFKPPTKMLPLFYKDNGFSGELNIDIFLQNFIQTYGITGTGKSNGLGKVCEELLKAGIKLLIMDIEGEYHTLTEMRNSRLKIEDVPDINEQFYAIDGKAKKELIDSQMEKGREFAKKYMESKYSYLLDLGAKTKEDYVPFLYGVLSELWVLRADEKKLGGNLIPIKIILDEAKEIVPLNPDSTLPKEILEISKMLTTKFKTVSTRGRKYGITTHLSGQRPADINSTVRNSNAVYILYSQTNKIDIEFYLTKIPHDRSTRANLWQDIQKLGKGEAFFINNGYAKRVRFRKKTTSDVADTPGYKESVGWKADA